MRRPAVKNKPRASKVKFFPAPTDGWIANENLASLPSKLKGAAILENWFPDTTGVRLRKGRKLHATIIDAGTPRTVKSMFTYLNGDVAYLFAATDGAIFNVSTGGTPAPTKTGAVGGDWSTALMATSGGVYLRLVNGIDTPLVFDQTSGWTTSPSITGSGLDSAKLNYVWKFKNRLFFVEKDSLTAWYLPVDSIGGAATKLPLQGVFPRGGRLLFGGMISLDESGGLNAMCVFVSSEGDVAVYQGTDPSVAANWSLVGVYRIGRPLGKDAWVQAGGDIVIATDNGMVPLSAAIRLDYTALAPKAVSFKIEDAWKRYVRERSGSWSALMWPAAGMMIVMFPYQTGVQAEMLAANARTGAWCKHTGIAPLCGAVFRDRCFIASWNGEIFELERTGQDNGVAFTATMAPLFSDFADPASLKTTKLVRGTFRASDGVNEAVTILTEFDEEALPAPPEAVDSPKSDIWGVGRWGAAVWGARYPQVTVAEWRSAGGAGYRLSPAFQVTVDSVSPPDILMISAEVTYEAGDIVS